MLEAEDTTMAEEQEEQDDSGVEAVSQSPDFSRRLSAMVHSAYWRAERPGGPGWKPGPDHPPGSCSYEEAVAFNDAARSERDALLDALSAYPDYDALPADLRDKLDLIERFNEAWFELEERAIEHAQEQMSFVPVGTVKLTDAERKAATDAAKQAKADGKTDVAKWFEDSLDSNPNAVRSVLHQMGLDDE